MTTAMERRRFRHRHHFWLITSLDLLETAAYGVHQTRALTERFMLRAVFSNQIDEITTFPN